MGCLVATAVGTRDAGLVGFIVGELSISEFDLTLGRGWLAVSVSMLQICARWRIAARWRIPTVTGTTKYRLIVRPSKTMFGSMNLPLEATGPPFLAFSGPWLSRPAGCG